MVNGKERTLFNSHSGSIVALPNHCYTNTFSFLRPSDCHCNSVQSVALQVKVETNAFKNMEKASSLHHFLRWILQECNLMADANANQFGGKTNSSHHTSIQFKFFHIIIIIHRFTDTETTFYSMPLELESFDLCNT